MSDGKCGVLAIESKKYYLSLMFIIVFMLIITFVSAKKDTDTVGAGELKNMQQQLNALINNEPDLQGALAGISIREAESGELLYDHLGDTRLKPASNLKILTASAALSVLGENYTFATEVYKEGIVKDGKLQGNLFLKGRGDPTLLRSDFETFARDLRKKGISTINGDIVGDDTWYDAIRLSKDLVWSDEHYHYGAQVSALTASPDTDYDAGTVVVEVTPGAKEGEKPDFSVSPHTDYIQIVNKAETTAKDEVEEEKELTLERDHGGNTITIEGEIPVSSEPVKEWVAVWEPTRYALELFQQALAANGISWTGKVKTGTTPQTAELLLEYQSITLADLLVPFMKLSNNGHGETLVKEMGKVIGREGSWDKGLEVMEAELQKLDVQTDKFILRDGSGISHVNHVTANEISGLLYRLQEKEWFPVFLRALPVAGEQKRMVGGTLQDRLSNVAVYAKTGTIDSVSTLSGYIETKHGKKVTFSILLNNMLDEEKGPDIEDKIIRIIDESV